MLVDTTCNAIAYNRKLTYTLARFVVDPSGCLFYVFAVHPLAYTHAIRYIHAHVARW